MHELLSAAGDGSLISALGAPWPVCVPPPFRVSTQPRVHAYVAKMPRAPRCCRARAMAARMPPPADTSVPLPSSSTSTRVPAVEHSSTRLRHVRGQAASMGQILNRMLQLCPPPWY